jgi:hypothetical protein
MKTEQMGHNIYFVIQPLLFLSRILGLSTFHTDPKYTFHNKSAFTVYHIIQVTLMILFLLFGLFSNILSTIQHTASVFNVTIRVVWIITILLSHVTNVLALLFSVTRTRYHMANVLSFISFIDNKLFLKNSKQNSYSQQRSYVKKQLWITFTLFGIVSASSVYSYYDGTWLCYIYTASQILSSAINTVMMFQYVNIVLIVKQRYQHMKHLLSEADCRDDFKCLRHINTERVTSYKTHEIFAIATYDLKNYQESNHFCRIQHFRVLYSELYDVIYANNKCYEVLILLDVTTRLTFIVPTLYVGIKTITRAIFQNGTFNLYLKSVCVLSNCAFMLLTLLWLILCCQKTTEETHEIFVCIQKLLLHPNAYGWSKTELKSFSSQLKNNKVEFNVCGFFTLNLQFFCASVSVIFTYMLVLYQFSPEV